MEVAQAGEAAPVVEVDAGNQAPVSAWLSAVGYQL